MFDRCSTIKEDIMDTVVKNKAGVSSDTTESHDSLSLVKIVLAALSSADRTTVEDA
ncbi:hypothetical protein HK098_004588 [Nowakowskiella sp. JEL0407]|nr:hypothetical protein HK098_004588 [Nowakowskiella sp. JEL0407]